MNFFNFRKNLLMLIDVILTTLSVLVSNAIMSLLCLVFDLSAKDYVVNDIRLWWIISLDILFCFFMLFLCGAYNRVWRDFNKKDYVYCLVGVAGGLALSVLFASLMNKQANWLFYVVNFFITCGSIILFRFIFKRTFINLTEFGRSENYERTLIVGAGQAAKMILTDIRSAHADPNNPSRNILPVCLVDDDDKKRDLKILGVEVAGKTKDIPRICKEYKIELILFAIPSCTVEERKEIMALCSETDCKIKMVPYLSQLLFDDDAPQLLNQVKDIKIEDLLGRDPITFDSTEIRAFIEDKVCLVTGGGGSIGSELVRQIAKYAPKKVIIVDIYENNAYDIQQELRIEYEDALDLVTLIASVRDYDKMDKIFSEYRPQVVFHAAAHKHVPLMETSPAEAVKNNIFGTWNMVTIAEKYNTEKFVMISTDKAVNPTNVMGATKRCCEMIVQYKSQSGSNTEFVTTRFGNVLGSNGSVIPLFRRQIEAGKPVTVTHPDIIRYFMTIPEAVSLVLQAGAMAHGGEIFVLDMGDPVKITTLAENLIRMYGKVPYKDVEIRFTGLRPGEKLFEELLMDEEGLKSTGNKKIFIGNQIDIDPQKLLSDLETLQNLAESNNNEETVSKLMEIVPTFNHKVN
ncbi:MAG: nucleoside-diphosphate sugar epimerase/dehydratase [Eubacteriales bacterium]|nr:nucleoside-diphosphate sugar epimerase/dehydratase [Eubacteriales bacterium]